MSMIQEQFEVEQCFFFPLPNSDERDLRFTEGLFYKYSWVIFPPKGQNQETFQWKNHQCQEGKNHEQIVTNILRLDLKTKHDYIWWPVWRLSSSQFGTFKCETNVLRCISKKGPKEESWKERAAHGWCVTMATAVCIPKITTHTNTHTHSNLITKRQKIKWQSVVVLDSMTVRQRSRMVCFVTAALKTFQSNFRQRKRKKKKEQQVIS